MGLRAGRAILKAPGRARGSAVSRARLELWKRPQTGYREPAAPGLSGNGKSFFRPKTYAHSPRDSSELGEGCPRPLIGARLMRVLRWSSVQESRQRPPARSSSAHALVARLRATSPPTEPDEGRNAAEAETAGPSRLARQLTTPTPVESIRRLGLQDGPPRRGASRAFAGAVGEGRCGGALP